jgi:hypothetical protein
MDCKKQDKEKRVGLLKFGLNCILKGTKREWKQNDTNR